MFKPTLTEPGVKYFLNETLKNCRKHKYEHYNQLLNIILFFIFFGILGIVIYYSYREKKDEETREEKNVKKQQYVLNMVREHNEKQLRKHGDKITDLPDFESEFEITMKKFL